MFDLTHMDLAAAAVLSSKLQDRQPEVIERLIPRQERLIVNPTLEAANKVKDLLKEGGATEVTSVLMDDMPEVAAGAKAVCRGDIRELYTIVDGGGLRLIIDPYTRKGFIEFYYSKYTGGAVVQPDAAKILTIKA